MSKSISYALPVNRKLTFWTKWEPPRGMTGAHLDVKPRTNIVWVHKVSLHFIVKAAWVFVFWCHHLSKHFPSFLSHLVHKWGTFHKNISLYLNVQTVDLIFNPACLHPDCSAWWWRHWFFLSLYGEVWFPCCVIVENWAQSERLKWLCVYCNFKWTCRF